MSYYKYCEACHTRKGKWVRGTKDAFLARYAVYDGDNYGSGHTVYSCPQCGQGGAYPNGRFIDKPDKEAK